MRYVIMEYFCTKSMPFFTYLMKLDVPAELFISCVGYGDRILLSTLLTLVVFLITKIRPLSMIFIVSGFDNKD